MTNIEKLILKLKFKWLYFKLRFKKDAIKDEDVDIYIYEADDD